MILDYYKLKEQPFGVTPDPRFLYMSASHREALASLSYGVQCRRGFMSLIAKPGMGKTTILFEFLKQLQDSARTVFLFQTLCSPQELFRALLHDLGVDASEDTGGMQEELNRILVAEARLGRRVVVVVDEAQNLGDDALEWLRMLSNFETSSYKLIQIILAGQPQLRAKLASPHLLQLRQRMSIVARIKQLSADEIRLYVRHRLDVAGYDFKSALFTPRAGTLIAEYSEGIPRNINNICFNALSLGCALKEKIIGEDIVRECLRDMDLDTPDEDSLDKLEKAPPISIKHKNEVRGILPRLSWRRIAVCLIVILQILRSSDVPRRRQGPLSHSVCAVSSIVSQGSLSASESSVSAQMADNSRGGGRSAHE